MDDICVFSRSWEEHVSVLTRLLDCLRRVGLRAHPTKSSFGVSSVAFLGFQVGGNGMSPELAKVAAIKEMGHPTNASELRSQLQFLNYYRSFVQDFSAISGPLRALLKVHACACAANAVRRG